MIRRSRVQLDALARQIEIYRRLTGREDDAQVDLRDAQKYITLSFAVNAIGFGALNPFVHSAMAIGSRTAVVGEFGFVGIRARPGYFIRTSSFDPLNRSGVAIGPIALRVWPDVPSTWNNNAVAPIVDLGGELVDDQKVPLLEGMEIVTGSAPAPLGEVIKRNLVSLGNSSFAGVSVAADVGVGLVIGLWLETVNQALTDVNIFALQIVAPE